jgi:hypothetical protein
MSELTFAQDQVLSWQSILIWLMVCLSLLVALLMLRRYVPTGNSRRGAVYHKIALGPKTSLHLLEYENRRYQIFETERGQLLLHSTEHPDAAEVE